MLSAEDMLIFSVVIPICNEEENIPELSSRLTAVMEKLCAEEGNARDGYEIVMVDDGSRDRSWELIKGLHARDSRIKGIRFSRNFGHHIALTAGLDSSEGRTVVLMDGDLQDPPEEIPKLYAKYREGFELVYGIRRERKDPLSKRATSSLFWWMLRRFTGVQMPAGQTMLRVLDRSVVDALNGMREFARFVHGMMAWTGFRTATVEIEHAARKKGTSKYNIPRLFKLAFHAITSFSTVPLRLAIYLGLMSSLFSLLIGGYFLYKRLFYNIPVLGYASIIVSIFFVGGIQLLMLGIFGEYLGRTYQEVQRRPLYIVRERL
ncbi:MAG: glycosyltransferase family 2 protein [Nitrospiraceae bacterium]|nr:glycosyltransferase family 2 protein [Nitrospiraceae bacterium]